MIAAKNDAPVAAFLDYRALLQCGAVEGNPHGIDIPAVLDGLKNDWTVGPRSRKALWLELTDGERDRIKAAKGQGGALTDRDCELEMVAIANEQGVAE